MADETEVVQEDPELSQGEEISTEPTQEAGETQEQFELRKALSESGFDVSDVEDDKTAYDRVVNYIQAQRKQLTEYQQAQAAALAQLRALQQQQPAKKEEADDKPWYAPAWNPPSMVGKYEDFLDPETGKFKIGTPPEVIQRYEYESNWKNQFVQNPYETLWGGFEPKIKETIRAEAERLLKEREDRQFFTEEEKRLEKLLYQFDDDGNPALDPYSMQRRFSGEGQRMGQLFRQLIDEGVPEKRAFEMAKNQVLLDLYQSAYQQQQQAPVKKTPQERKEDHVRRAANGANRVPGRGGTVAAAADPVAPQSQNSKADFKRRALARAREKGLAS